MPLSLTTHNDQNDSCSEQEATTSKKAARNMSRTLPNLDTSSECDSNLDDDQETASGGIYTDAKLQSPNPYYSNSEAEDDIDSPSRDDKEKTGARASRSVIKKTVEGEQEASEQEEESEDEVIVRRKKVDLGISDFELSSDTSDEEENARNRKKRKERKGTERQGT